MKFFLITNDFQSPVDSVVFRYAKGWRIESGIAEAVKFFSLNALPSPVLIKVHFNVLMTMIAHGLYHFLSQKLRGFEHCRSSTIFRKFIDMKADILAEGNDIIVHFPRRAHNPIIKAARLRLWPTDRVNLLFHMTPLRRGSKESLNPSPTMLKAKTTIITARPGANESTG